MLAGAVLLAFSVAAFSQAPILPPVASTSAASAEAPAKMSPAEYVPILNGLMHDTQPFLTQLQLVEESYKDPRSKTPWAVRRLAAERTRLRAAIQPRLDEFSRLEDEFNDRHREDNTTRGIQALLLLMSGKKPKNSAEIIKDGVEVINDVQTYNNLGRQYRGWRESATNLLETEETSFKMAEHVVVVQEILALIAGAFLFVFIIALVLWLKTARAKSRLETDISKLAASSGSTYLGVDSPGTPMTPAAIVLGGNYVVEKELGRGGMGIVYAAMDLSLRRKVAIKKLRAELQEQTQDLELLINEARMVAKLEHPNIIKIFTIFREKGDVYLVFEYVDGRTVHEVLREYARLTLRQARSLVHQIGAALDYAHGQRIIHRDLKPSNIIVTSEGVAKVMDFGIAHQAKATVARMTQSRAWGTPAYMAPEQETGSVSREADLYALGVLVYEMMTGRLPFDGPNFLAQKSASMFAPASKLNPALTPAFDLVIQRALQPDPAARFHSAAELIAALDALPDAV